jgi:hypothetical protein
LEKPDYEESSCVIAVVCVIIFCGYCFIAGGTAMEIEKQICCSTAIITIVDAMIQL